MSVKNKIKTKLEQLIEQGKQLHATGFSTEASVYQPSMGDVQRATAFGHAPPRPLTRQYRIFKKPQEFQNWRVSSLAFLDTLFMGKPNYFRTEFEKIVEQPQHLLQGVGILEGVLTSHNDETLYGITSIVYAEVFTDFLDMAEMLLDQHYKDPAAMLIGAVLEDGCRQICDKNNITRSKNDLLDALIKKLKKENIVNAALESRLGGWRIIRNKADHGEFTEYLEKDVVDMLAGVRDFIAEKM